MRTNFHLGRLTRGAVGLVAGTFLITSAVSAQDIIEDEFDDADLDYVEEDHVPEAERVLPPGVMLVRSGAGEYQPPFELRGACSGDWCGDIVINTANGRIVFAQGRWQPGALETGYGEEVIVAIEQ